MLRLLLLLVLLAPSYYYFCYYYNYHLCCYHQCRRYDYCPLLPLLPTTTTPRNDFGSSA